MTSHKFLAKGAIGPFSGFAWPAAGTWVEAAAPLAECARGIHVCRPGDLAHWIHDELWEVETDGTAVTGHDCLVVPRAALVRRIDGWDRQRARFADACLERAAGASGPLLDDARYMAQHGLVALVAFTTALAASRAGAGDPDATYQRERAWQSAWLARELL